MIKYSFSILLAKYCIRTNTHFEVSKIQHDAVIIIELHPILGYS